jgi:hypothetical protein
MDGLGKVGIFGADSQTAGPPLRQQEQEQEHRGHFIELSRFLVSAVNPSDTWAGETGHRANPKPKPTNIETDHIAIDQTSAASLVLTTGY